MNYRELLDANGFNGGCGLSINFSTSASSSEEELLKLRTEYVEAKAELDTLGNELTRKDLDRVLELARDAERKCAYYIVSSNATRANEKKERQDAQDNKIVWSEIAKGNCMI